MMTKVNLEALENLVAKASHIVIELKAPADTPAWESIAKLSPLVASIIALIGVFVALHNVTRQIKSNQKEKRLDRKYQYATLRNEAVRRKRATAKAFLEEIRVIESAYRQRGDASTDKIPTNVFDKLIPEIGRLDEQTIGHVVALYSYVKLFEEKKNIYSEADINEGNRIAGLARTSLESFLSSTKNENIETSDTLKSLQDEIEGASRQA